MRILARGLFLIAILPCLLTGTEKVEGTFSQNELEVVQIGPTATPTVGQVFWLEIPVPPSEVAKPILPPGVILLDQTTPDSDAASTRFYLRATRGLESAELRVNAAGQETVVPLRVRNLRQDIEEHLLAIPDWDPSIRKQSRAYYTDEKIARARENIREFPLLKKRVAQSWRFDNLTDDETLFQSLPSWNVPREVYGNFPCPQCGDVIFERSAYYPYLYEPKDHPFALRCPECKTIFPSNDWANDDFTSGPYPDDGWGWAPGSETSRNERSAWVAHFNHARQWRWLGGHLQLMALRYLLLDDKAAAHRTAILLARLAYVYPGMDTRWQQVGDTFLRPGRILIDGNWERSEITIPAIRAYDAIFDYIDEDNELVSFLQSKDPSIQSSDDVKKLIENAFVQPAIRDILNRNFSNGNMGALEFQLIQMLTAADMPELTEVSLDDLFHNSFNSGTNRGNFLDQNFINLRTREGPSIIAGLFYSPNYLQKAIQVADELAELDPPEEFAGRLDLFDAKVYPHLNAEHETWLDYIVAGRFAPNWGDGADPPGAIFPDGVTMGAHMRNAYETIYRARPSDALARALMQIGPPETPPLFQEDIRAELSERAEASGPQPPRGSRVYDGFGVVLMESRPDAENIDDRAGLSLRYGYSRGHNQQDNLDLQLFAGGAHMTPHLGYPTWAHPLGSTGHVAHHNTGFIDRSPQYAYVGESRMPPTARGTLIEFAPAAEASFAAVESKPTGFPNETYRRAVCLVDAPGNKVYAFDVFQMSGGTIRTYGLHGPPSIAFESSETMIPSGEPYLDVGAFPPTAKQVPNILNPAAVTTDQTFVFDWAFPATPPENWSGLNTAGLGVRWPELAPDTRFRVTLPGTPDRTYITAEFAKPDSVPIRFLYAEDKQPQGESQFTAFWEPYSGTPFIQSIRNLEIDKQSESSRPGFEASAFEVILTEGRKDIFILNLDTPENLIEVEDEILMQGSFAYLSYDASGLRVAHLVGGSTLIADGIEEEGFPSRQNGRIGSVDYIDSLVTLDSSVDAKPGDYLFINNGNRSMAYEIEEQIEANRLRLRHNPLLYRGNLINSNAGENAIVVDIPPPIETAGGFPDGYYDRTWLTDDQLEHAIRVRSIKGTEIRTEEAIPLEEGFAAGSPIRLYEFGQGDQFLLHRNFFHRRTTTDTPETDTTED